MVNKDTPYYLENVNKTMCKQRYTLLFGECKLNYGKQRYTLLFGECKLIYVKQTYTL